MFFVDVYQCFSAVFICGILAKTWVREAENVGRKKPLIKLLLKKECLTCHENSAANTSSQLKLLIKEVGAEEMHFPNWMLDLQSV